MTPERYQALLRWLEARPALKKLVIALNRWLPAVPFACYPLLLVLLNVRWFRLLSANRAAALDFMQLIARAVFVPAFVFLGGTLLHCSHPGGGGGAGGVCGHGGRRCAGTRKSHK